MTEARDLYQVTAPVTDEELDAALLDMTGDLDKAKVLHETLPHWMVEAPPDTLAAIEQAYIDSALPRQRLEQRLARLQPLDEFCVEKLHKYLVGKGHLELNVRLDYFERPRREPFEITPNVTGIPVYSTTLEKHSLVQAAMQNFSAAEAETGGLPEKTRIRRGVDDSVAPGISAAQFVRYCRDLDLGRAYQAHVREVFSLPATGEPALALSYNESALDIGRGKCADMQVDLQIALAKQHISQVTHGRLLRLIKADLPAAQQPESVFTQKRLIWQGLNMDEACLWSVLVFSEEEPGQLATSPLIVYMPNEPVRPWYEYPTLEDFRQYLTLKLQVPSYRRAFERYLDESERVDFLNHFDAHRTLGPLQAIAVSGSFSEFFFRAYVGKIQLDAQLLAVPKAFVDEDARKQRLLDYLNVGLDILNVAAFVVPVLGQLMMGVAIGQLLGEVFDGVEDWSHGDNAEALKHLINVAHNLAAMMLFAAGGRVVGSLKRKLASSAEFFDKVEAVNLHDYRTKLWRPRLDSYRQSTELPEPWVGNTRGVHQANGGAYIKLAGQHYAIVFDPNIGQWRVSHPQRWAAFRPPLKHNFQGGWQHDFERPQEWTDPLYTLQRIDPSLAAVPADALQSVAAINQLDQAALRRLMQAQQALSERFQDALARFRLHRKVLDLAAALASAQPLDRATARSQMLALPLMPSWPQGRFFELLDPQGNLLESHPDLAPFDYEDQSIHITQHQLNDGQVMDTVLQALSDEERTALLGETVELKDAQPLLRRRLLETVSTQHRALYRKLYDEYNGTAVGELAPLCARFPQLPRRVAWELLSGARPLDRQVLRKTGRLPLVLEQNCREAVEQMAEDQAVMGLYFPELAGAATRRLTFGLLSRLANWPRDLFVQLREGSLTGDVLEQTGPPDASVRRTIVRKHAGFQAFDEQGKGVNALLSEPHGLLQSLVDCLSPTQRQAMKLTSSEAVDRLRSQLRFKSQDERVHIARYLSPERATPAAESPACAPTQVRPAPALPGAFVPPAGLVRKVKKLYPAMSDAQAAQRVQGAGADHMSRAKAIQALEQQLKALQQALKLWASDRSRHVVEEIPLWDYRLSRHQARIAIEDCWRGLSSVRNELHVEVPGLVLNSFNLGSLPTLPPTVRFDHVQELHMRSMRLNDDVAYFLKHFSGLRTLDLAENQLTRLPEALSLMPDLEYLRLPRNRLQLTEHTRKKLAEMRQLKSLNLTSNPLLNPPDVAHQFDLRELVLRDCQLTELPGGVHRLPHLEQVDLRYNDIQTLPDWLMELPRGRGRVFNLRHNPLSVMSRVALMNYRQRVGVGMGFIEDDISRLDEQKAREIWLADERVAGYTQKDLAWTGLKNEAGSDGLFKLLAELSHTSDATRVRDDLTRRVWRVLDATATDAELREEVFQRAATPINCDDSAAINFSSLEILVEIHQAQRDIKGGRLTARPLLKLARGLFRVEQLEGIARRHSLKHPTADPLEVSLAFRTGLRGSFYLPGQPEGMRYESLAKVTQLELAAADTELRNAETSPELLSYIVKLPFWKDYLKRTFASRFEARLAPFQQRMHGVFDQRSTLQNGDYQSQVATIEQEQAQVEAAEIESLTENALRLDDLNLAVC